MCHLTWLWYVLRSFDLYHHNAFLEFSFTIRHPFVVVFFYVVFAMLLLGIFPMFLQRVGRWACSMSSMSDPTLWCKTISFHKWSYCKRSKGGQRTVLIGHTTITYIHILLVGLFRGPNGFNWTTSIARNYKIYNKQCFSNRLLLWSCYLLVARSFNMKLMKAEPYCRGHHD